MVYMFLSKGFEEIEAITPLDILRRAEVEIKTVSIDDAQEVIGAHGISVTADLTESEFLSRFDKDPIEMIIFPGGMPGTLNLDKWDNADRVIQEAMAKDAYITAICAAPRILGRRGVLNGKNAVCYPGNEGYLEGATVVSRSVVCDGRIITASGMGAAFEFGIALAKALKGEEIAQKIKMSATVLPA